MCDLCGAAEGGEDDTVGVLCFGCLGHAFKDLEGDVVDTAVVRGNCVAGKADCQRVGCRLRMCTSCVLRAMFPAMQSGDYLVTNIDGTEPTMTTSAALAVEVFQLRLSGINAAQRDGLKASMLSVLKAEGRIATTEAQAVRVQ